MDEDISNKLLDLKIARNWSFRALIVVWVVQMLITYTYIDLGREGWTKYSSDDLVMVNSSSDIEALSSDPEGQIWLGTKRDLIVHGEDGKWNAMAIEGLDARRYIQALEIDNAGNVWVGTNEGLLVLSPYRGWTRYSSKETGIVQDNIQTVAVDDGGRIWVGASYGVLGVLNLDGSWSTYTSNRVQERILALGFDAVGRVWVGTIDGLAILAPDGSWTFHPSEEVGSVRDFVIDQKGRLWVATSRGLRVHNLDGSWTNYTSENSGLVHDSVISLLIDEMDQIWVGTKKGLSVLSPDGAWVTYLPNFSTDPSQSGNNVRDLAFDNQGYLWLYTSMGLSKFDESASAKSSVLQPFAVASSTLIIVRNFVAAVFVILLIAYEILLRRMSIKRFIIDQTPGIALMIWSIFPLLLGDFWVSDPGSFMLLFYPAVSLMLWLGAGFRWPKKAISTALLGTLGYGLSHQYLWIQFLEGPGDGLTRMGMALITYGCGAMGVICFLSVNLGSFVAKWNKGKEGDRKGKTD